MFTMARLGIALSLTCAAALAIAAVTVVPRGYEAGRLLAAQDDPAELADLSLKSFDAATARREIEEALAAKDAELARSFAELADERGVPVDPALRKRIATASEEAASMRHAMKSFAYGFVTGEPDDVAGIAGTALGDLLVFGDIRDTIREGSRMVRGEEANRLVLGLSVGGLVFTAATLVTAGVGAPARVGVSVLKAAGKSGRIGTRLTRVLAVEGTESLVKLTGDLGRVQSKAGTKAALESVRLAEHPKDVARVATLAVAKGGKTRAILKLLGRGAIFLAASAFNLALWVLWAVMTIIGFCASLKRAVERMTLAAIRAGKARRQRRAAALLAAAAAPPASSPAIAPLIKLPSAPLLPQLS
jgi:hypothetical protein